MEFDSAFQAIGTLARALPLLPGGQFASLVFAACSGLALVKVFRCATRAP